MKFARPTQGSTTMHNAHTRSPFRPGFSLIEMLTVLGILAIVLAIIIPALGGARNSARKADTQSMLSNLSTAINSFQISERRLPGYYSAKDMGADENRAEGFSTMENIMLDLAGGIIGPNSQGSQGSQGSGPDSDDNIVEVGPINVRPVNDPNIRLSQVRVDLTLIGTSKQSASGASTKAYYTPDSKYFKVIEDVNSGYGDRLGSGHNKKNPVLVDTWGQPILAWAINEQARPDAVFAAATSSTTAKFYLAANATFLSTKQLGKMNVNPKERSLLGTGNTGTSPTDAARVKTLEALLGNPAFPQPGPRAGDPGVPAAARAPIVLHSAGPSGTYLDRSSRGGKTAGLGTDAFVQYRVQTEVITNGNFEDILYNAGN